MTHSWLWRWPLSDVGYRRVYLVRANHAPDDPARVHLEPVPPLFAWSAIDAWRSEDVQVLQDVFCELTLGSRSSLHLHDERELREKIGARLRQALERGELVALRDTRALPPGASRGPDAETRAPRHEPAEPRPPRAPEATTDLSFYEIVLLDELEAPIPGVTLRVNTPAGEVVRRTDSSGRVRVDAAPAGWGSAAISGVDELAKALAGRERRPRRVAPLPEGDAWHVRLPSRFGDAVSLPDAEPQKLMLVTRVDLAHVAQPSPWPALSLVDDQDGPWQLTVAEEKVMLALHAVARGAQAVVQAVLPELPPAPRPPVAPPPVHAGLWIAPDVYVVQSGDTLERIASRYLGDGARWGEIWALNRERYAGRSPDVIFPGDTFVMPTEAIPEWVALPTSAAPPPDAPAPAAPPPPEWFRAAVDALHEALFQGHLDPVWRFLESIPLDLPALPTDTPPPFIEELVYRSTMVELALEGRVDPVFKETEQV
ncbi:LysM peptidoglycan-binding domain-containing protein [Sorangium sp. So ce131]|uniref:LysM peptidoglycan-binding domain-containing protein n=1 Tax=Sorangium sp. So ce131 TaxID=3133282 RepID=UPI003F62D36D